MIRPKPKTTDAPELRLRPWGEVARLFTEKTGLRMTHKHACMLHHKAMRKIRHFFADELKRHRD